MLSSASLANADPVYNLLKGASMLRKGGDGDSSGVSSMRSLPRQNTASSGRSGSSRSSSPGMYTGGRLQDVMGQALLHRGEVFIPFPGRPL